MRQCEILVVSRHYPAHGGDNERAAGRLISEIAEGGGFRFVWAANAGDAGEKLPDTGKCALLPLRGLLSLPHLFEAAGRADLVWIHDALHPFAISAFVVARARKKPIVITHYAAPPPKGDILGEIGDRIFTMPMLKAARQAAFSSDSAAENYHRRASFGAPIEIVPNGVDLNIFRPASSEKRRFNRDRFALREEQPVFLYVAPFTAEAGLLVIRQLAKLLPDCRFWLAEREKTRGGIDPRKWYAPNVHVLGVQGAADLAELCQAADLLVMPGWAASFPLIIQEAMACGLPVLCSPITSAGSRPAAPHLLTAPVYPNAQRTAQAWLQRIKALRASLPIEGPKPELAAAARSFWQWPVIAGHYAAIFQRLAPQSDQGRTAA